MATNTVTAAGNPYMANLAGFAQAYGATDAESLYNSSSIFGNPMMAMADPAMSMMGMMNPMMMGMYNPMMKQMFTPAAYDAQNNGINPMGAFYFGKNSERFAQYNQENVNIQDGLRLLGEYAAADNQDDFISAYNNLVNDEKQRIKSLQPNISGAALDTAARTQINKQFAQLAGGVSLSQILKQNGDNPFWQGMKDMISFGVLNDKKTVHENIARVNGVNSPSQRRREKAGQWLGRITVAGSAAGLGHKMLWKCGNWGKAAAAVIDLLAIAGLTGYAAQE